MPLYLVVYCPLYYDYIANYQEVRANVSVMLHRVKR